MDRVQSLTVALAMDVREDDITSLAAAIAQFRGVIAVRGDVVSGSDFVARQRVRAEFRMALLEWFDSISANNA
jgi:hypothetical protein